MNKKFSGIYALRELTIFEKRQNGKPSTCGNHQKLLNEICINGFLRDETNFPLQ